MGGRNPSPGATRIWQGPPASFFCSPPSWLISFTLIHVIRPGVTSPETTRSLGLNVFLYIILSPCLVVFPPFSPGPKTVQFTFSPGKCRGEEGPRGLSEDTDGVIEQRRKRDSKDLPPAPLSPRLIF
jgi:hypothetical protein